MIIYIAFNYIRYIWVAETVPTLRPRDVIHFERYLFPQVKRQGICSGVALSSWHAHPENPIVS